MGNSAAYLYRVILSEGIARKANDHVVEGPRGSSPGNVVAGNFHVAEW